MHAVQVWVAGLHTGLIAEQSELTTHAAQVFRSRSHNGDIPVQAVRLPAVHSTHAPEVVLQAGVAVNREHCESVVQATQVWVDVSHRGCVAVQSVLPLHATHVWLAVSQTGVPPVHIVAFEAVQCTQAPEVVSQAGSAPPH